MTDDPGLIVTTATDLSSVVPLKKQQGFLGMVSQILNKMGNLASSFLPSILQIVLSLLSTCVFALEHREKVSWYRWINTCVSVSDQVVHLGIGSNEYDYTTTLIFYQLCDRIHTSGVVYLGISHKRRVCIPRKYKWRVGYSTVIPRRVA